MNPATIQTNASAARVTRWQGGTYSPHQTRRMLELEGVD